MTVLTLPGRFWDDSCSREINVGELVRWTGSRVVVEMNDDQIAELRADAEFYASDQGWDASVRGLQTSARATLRALDRISPVDSPVSGGA